MASEIVTIFLRGIEAKSRVASSSDVGLFDRLEEAIERLEMSHDLLEEGLVVERADSVRQAPSPTGGRPPTLLTLDPSSSSPSYTGM